MEHNFIDLLREVYLIFLSFFQWFLTSASGNIIGITSLGAGLYFFFKGIKRLVYSIESKEIISEDLKSVDNLVFLFHNERISSLYISELIIYNNGQKSINKEDVSILIIKLKEGRIFDYTERKKHEASVCKLEDNMIKITLNEFDTRDFLVLRIFHDSALELEGRIKESGNLLNRENIWWKIINFILLIITLTAFYWGASKIDENDLISWKWVIVILISIMAIYKIIDIIYGLFFIPLRIMKKYLKNE